MIIKEIVIDHSKTSIGTIFRIFYIILEANDSLDIKYLT